MTAPRFPFDISAIESPLWIDPPNGHTTAVASLSQTLSISPFLATLLANRGLGAPEAASLFLEPTLSGLANPFGFADMDRAVARLVAALKGKEKIAIYGDYDVDGTSAAALLFEFFSALGHPPAVYIPDRVREGYSLNRTALDYLKAQGISVVITVDNGTMAFDGARHAREIGLDLIVTDHHGLGDVLPPAVAVVNPLRRDNSGDVKGVAGVGIAFFLAMALRKAIREDGDFASRPEPNLRRLLDLVALGTVADVAPLTGQNRILVKYGLELLRKSPRPGLSALAQVARLPLNKISAGDVAFFLAPRINAAGRVGNVKDALALLSAPDLERAMPLAQKLDGNNETRRKIETLAVCEAEAIFESQSDAANRMACMVAKADWNPGVIGIVAARLVDRYRRPALVMAWDGKAWKGSARSVPGFILNEAIAACGEHLIQFGGHPQAAGFSVAEEKLQDFYRAFETLANKTLTPDACRKRLLLDMHLEEPIHAGHLEDISRLEPLGEGNRAPLLAYRGVAIESVRYLSEGKHVKCAVRRSDARFSAIAFRAPERYRALLTPQNALSIAFRPEWNRWNGTDTIQLQLVDIRAD